jgi:queuine/archaeosine tRNA-ribosyltransferase
VEFVASATLKRYDLRGLLERWERAGSGPDPFSSLILTPLPGLSPRPTVEFVRQHFVGRSRIWFDSGGFFVQQGEIAYEDLYRRLLTWYREEQWADVYVLPDYVPSSGLTAREVEDRVQATIAVARLFSAELPDFVRQRAMPVVQGHTREQIRACVEVYMDLGYQAIGFGSFDTGGSGTDINLLTRRALENLSFLQEMAARHGLRTHAFGVGTPALIPTLQALGVTSFDSSCWIRTAGFGNVLLPFLGRRNVSHGMLREIGGPAYDEQTFIALKELTGHACPFCTSFTRLQQDRLDQALHNLLVIRETVARLESGTEALPVPLRAMIESSRYERIRSA